MRLITLQINNWETYNPRADRGNYAWFKFRNDFFSDQNLFGQSDACRLMFIFLCCEASRTNSGEIALNTKYVAAILSHTEKQVIENINILSSTVLVTVINGSSRDCDAARLVAKKDLDLGDLDLGDLDKKESFSEPSKVLEALPEFLMIDKTLSEIFRIKKINQKLQRSWLQAFKEPEWIIQEINKALAWECSNIEKKNFGKFMTGWLNRGWDSRKIINNHGMSKNEQASQKNMDQMDRIEKGLL